MVEASDETLLHWTVNALNRNSYGCRIVPNGGAPELPRLTVSDAHTLTLRTAAGVQPFTTFDALIEGLKKQD